MVQVTIFNTNTLGVSVQVNNGPQFQIAGAPPSGAPQVPAYGGPSWSNTTAAPNVLAPGQNSLILTPTGAAEPWMTTLTLPANLQWSSVQIYLFFNSYHDLSWVLLNQGQYVTGNMLLRQKSLDEDAPVQTA